MTIVESKFRLHLPPCIGTGIPLLIECKKLGFDGFSRSRMSSHVIRVNFILKFGENLFELEILETVHSHMPCLVVD